jgi:hypothetical protein
MAGVHWMDSIINLSFQSMGIEVFDVAQINLLASPNPASHQLNIKYEIHDSEKVRIRILDIQSKKMDVITNEEKQQGEYSINWNIIDYPSGVYLFYLETGSEMATKNNKS